MLRKVTVFLSIAALLVLAGCSKPAATPAPAPAPAPAPGAPKTPDPVTISYWNTYSTDSPENKTFTQEVIPAFQKKYPYITVNAVVQPYDDMHTALVTSAAGGKLPDVMRLDIIWSPELAKLGVLEPLDGYDGFAAAKSSIGFPGPLSTNNYKGKYYGLPLDTNTQVQVYNPAFLKEAGLSAPPKTIDEFKKFVSTFNGKDGRYGLALGGTYPWQVLPYFWSMGGQVTNADYTKASGFVNSADSVAALQFLADLNKAGAMAPSMIGGQPGTWDGFKAGKYGSVLEGPWFFAAMLPDLKDKMVGAVVPSGKAGSISVVGGENIAIAASSKQKDAAWKFVQFMLSDEAQTTMAKVGQMPVTASASSNAVMKTTGYYDAYVEQLKTANARTPVPNWTKIDTALGTAFESVFRQKAEPKAALDQAAKEIDALLAQ